MAIYSSKTQNVRSVTIEPKESWGGQGLLGVSISFCSFEGANENVWHVLEVHPSSPAELAGLKSFTDYIIGSDSVLQESEDLFALIEAHEGRSLKLYVYNSMDDTCREVTIIPNGNWGGEGSLGCGIGYGYLHRIPVRITPPNSTVTTTIYKQLANQKPTEIVTNSSNVIEPSQHFDMSGMSQVQSNVKVPVLAENLLQNQLPVHNVQNQLPNTNIVSFPTMEPTNLMNTNNLQQQQQQNVINSSLVNQQIDSSQMQTSTIDFKTLPSNVPSITNITVPTTNLNAFSTTIPNIPTNNFVQSSINTNVNLTSLSYPIQPSIINTGTTTTNVMEQPSTMIPMYNPNMLHQQGTTTSTFSIQPSTTTTTGTLFYDPDIAAKSARQILTNERMSK